MRVPDLSVYHLARIVDDAPAWGIQVPGLRACFHQREEDTTGRIETVGVYTYGSVEIFLAWGFADEIHCTGHAFRTVTGGLEQARRGCPRVRAVKVGQTVTGLLLRTRSGDRLLTERVSAGQSLGGRRRESPCVPRPGSPSSAPVP